ncbi:MAG: hypothetical protein AABX19_02215 [Nanoarchaeota archaeon]
MTTFVCRNCRFKYTPRTMRLEVPQMCHNCGKKGTVEKEPDAEQILRDSNLDF